MIKNAGRRGFVSGSAGLGFQSRSVPMAETA